MAATFITTLGPIVVLVCMSFLSRWSPCFVPSFFPAGLWHGRCRHLRPRLRPGPERRRGWELGGRGQRYEKVPAAAATATTAAAAAAADPEPLVFIPKQSPDRFGRPVQDPARH